MAVAVLSVVFAVVGSPASPACACSCALASEQEYVAHAELVMQAVVTDLQPPTVVRSSGDPVQVHLAVERVDKGEAAERITLTTAVEEASCGFTFQVGHRYLIHANNGTTGLCSGNQDLGAAPDVPPEPGGSPDNEAQESRIAGGVVGVGSVSLAALTLVAGLLFARRRAAKRRTTSDVA